MTCEERRAQVSEIEPKLSSHQLTFEKGEDPDDMRMARMRLLKALQMSE